MPTVMKFENLFLTQTRLAAMIGKDRTTIRAYHAKGLRYRPGPRKTNEYHATASVNWTMGHEIARRLGLDLFGVEPLALKRYLFSLDDYGSTDWVEEVTKLGAQMGYDENECLLAAGKINGLVSAGKLRG